MSKRSKKREMSGCEEEAVAVESHLQFRGANKVPNSGLGLKRDQSAKMVPILRISPKFLILTSVAAEKGRYAAVSHCCALLRHTRGCSF